MKQTVSGFFKFISLIYLTFPIVFGISVAILFDIPLSEMAPVFLSPFFYVVCAFAMLVGLGLWEVKRWSWHLCMFVNVLILYESAYIAAHFGSSHHKILALLFLGIVVTVFAYRVTAEIRVPYFFPRIRWWETGSRGFCDIPVTLKSQTGRLVQGAMMDLSMTGCFVKTAETFDGEDRVQVQFQYARQDFAGNGQILWRASSSVTTPKGLGLYFSRLERPQRRMLRVIVHRIKRQTRLSRRVQK